MEDKGTVCVTGGTGFLASWMIMKLLQHGYSVNTTVRSYPDHKKDISYLTNLPGASARLQIFPADLENPRSFKASIEGCMGVFHTAHVTDFDEKEDEETITKRTINGTIGILQACLDSKTVKRVVYTSSAAAVTYSGQDLTVMDESSWTNVDFVRDLKPLAGSYIISKTLTERAALEFAEKHGLDLVTLIPTFMHGPFLTPHYPDSVRILMSMIFGVDHEYQSKFPASTFVHVDDVASAHMFLLEYPNSKGRYICSAVEIEIDKLSEFLSTRYPQYQIPSAEFLKQSKDSKHFSVSSKKLLDTGFKFKYGLEEIYDECIQCCKQKGLL